MKRQGGIIGASVSEPTSSGALRTGSRASEAILWQNLNQLYDK